MSKFRFNPEDFGLDEYYNSKESYPQLNSYEAAGIANLFLDEERKKCTKLYETSSGWITEELYDACGGTIKAFRTALLWDVTSLDKDEEEK